MTKLSTLREAGVAGGLVAILLALGACSDVEGDNAGKSTSITWLVENTQVSLASAEQIVQDFEALNPDINVELETRPQGPEGTGIVRERLGADDMADLFTYPTNPLLPHLDPVKNILPVTGEPFMEDVSESYKKVASAGGEVYGVPFGSGSAAAVLYNKKVYEELGLTVPATWDEFMENNEKIAAAGRTAIIQTYGTNLTAQLFVVGDFANVALADPYFAEKYTANETRYATHSAAIKGFEHHSQAYAAGMFNKDAASADLGQALAMLAAGKGVHYPAMTSAIGELALSFPDQLDDIGLFPFPADNTEESALTIWLPESVHVSNSTEHAEAAMKLQAFIVSPKGCASLTAAAATGVTAPYLVETCDLPEGAPPAVQDMLPYFLDSSLNSPALALLSPAVYGLPGSALDYIAIEVGSGVIAAADGAELYDWEVEKRARQLKLPGWN
jgi:raffinose/stachyose/melibiose transport system substrate-binding protein